MKGSERERREGGGLWCAVVVLLRQREGTGCGRGSGPRGYSSSPRLLPRGIHRNAQMRLPPSLPRPPRRLHLHLNVTASMAAAQRAFPPAIGRPDLSVLLPQFKCKFIALIFEYTQQGFQKAILRLNCSSLSGTDSAAPGDDLCGVRRRVHDLRPHTGEEAHRQAPRRDPLRHDKQVLLRAQGQRISRVSPVSQHE